MQGICGRCCVADMEHAACRQLHSDETSLFMELALQALQTNQPP